MPRLDPLAFTGSAELAAMVARVMPSIIELLADGVPRTKAAIVEALAGRHAEADAALALVRLAVTGQVEDTAGSTCWRRWTGCNRRALDRSGMVDWTLLRRPAPQPIPPGGPSRLGAEAQCCERNYASVHTCCMQRRSTEELARFV